MNDTLICSKIDEPTRTALHALSPSPINTLKETFSQWSFPSGLMDKKTT